MMVNMQLKHLLYRSDMHIASWLDSKPWCRYVWSMQLDRIDYLVPNHWLPPSNETFQHEWQFKHCLMKIKRYWAVLKIVENYLDTFQKYLLTQFLHFTSHTSHNGCFPRMSNELGAWSWSKNVILTGRTLLNDVHKLISSIQDIHQCYQSLSSIQDLCSVSRW